MKRSYGWRSSCASILVTAFAITVAGGAQATVCGSGTYPFPFTDVGSVVDTFCLGIMEAYVLGVTRGTTATTFSPTDNVPRVQMTTFLQRTIDQSLKRSSRRMALGQWWTPKTQEGLQRIDLPGPGPASFCRADGERVFVGNGPEVSYFNASKGTFENQVAGPTGASQLGGVLVVNGLIIAIDGPNQKMLIFSILSSGGHSSVHAPLSIHPNNLGYDGTSVWTANFADGTLSRFSWNSNLSGWYPGFPVTFAGFTAPLDVVFDGSNLWVSEAGGANRIRKVDANGSTLQTVGVGTGPAYMVYDGANLWVPNFGANSITVVQASSGAVVATIQSNAANGLSQPLQAAFDGERILVTNSGNDSLTLFRAADLSLLANIPLEPGAGPIGACSDGINFWVVLRGSKQLLRL